MLLLQARQLLPQRAFFLVGHCHRWFALSPIAGLGKTTIIIAFSTRAFKRAEKSPPINGFWCHLPHPGAGYIVALVPSLS